MLIIGVEKNTIFAILGFFVAVFIIFVCWFSELRAQRFFCFFFFFFQFLRFPVEKKSSVLRKSLVYQLWQSS